MNRRFVPCALAIIIATTCFSPAAVATNFGAAEIDKANPYRDLPGVKDPADVKTRGAGVKCRAEVRMIRGERGGAGISATEPAVVYICEENGVTFESTRPPVPETWIPGINPRSLR